MPASWIEFFKNCARTIWLPFLVIEARGVSDFDLLSFSTEFPMASALFNCGPGSVATLVLVKITDAVVGLRVDPDTEIEGLDLTVHGERGYDL